MESKQQQLYIERLIECAKKYSKRRGFILKPDYSAAGKAYLQLSNIYLENDDLKYGFKYLESGIFCFEKSGEIMIAAKASEKLVQFLCENCDSAKLIQDKVCI